MRRFFFIFTAILLLLLSTGTTATSAANAGKKTATKEQADSTTSKKAPKKTPYEKLVGDFKDSANGGFMNLHRNGKNNIYIEFPKENLGRRILYGGTVRTVSDPSSIDVGYKYSEPKCFQVELQDSIVVLLEPQTDASSSDPQMAKAMERNFTPKILKRLSVDAFSPDSSSFFFDATALINAMQSKAKGFGPSKVDDKSTWFGEMKSFKDNASIVLNYNMETSRSILGFKIPTGSGSMSCTVSFLLLPEDLMKPRIQDSRVGVFSTGGKGALARYDISTKHDGFKGYRLANRWKVEPVDMDVWKSGKLTDVKKPIVWYVDDAFPESWKEPIKKAVLDWNMAFEKIGLRNVMQCREFPTAEEDPEFDPANLKYSCIRYIPYTTMNAMGPSWVDPVTGEILNASVLVYNDVVKLIRNWRFVQTSQVDERVRSGKLPKDVIDESLEYVVAHEIGHTLGLMHNMGASANFPVDSLRSASFTAKYGTTPSIMDYARFNYVAQPGDEGVKLTPPTLGMYDEYAIEWLYKPVPEASDAWEEARILEKFVDEKAANPWFEYRQQQISSVGYGDYDPAARAEDLGDDPIKAGEYGISNLKYILPNLNAWVKDDPDRSVRTDLYNQIANQYNRYLGNVLAQVGGIYLHEVKDGMAGEPVSTVPALLQKESLEWVIENVRESSWIDDRNVTAAFALHTPVSSSIAQAVGEKLTSEVPVRTTLATANAGEKEAYSTSEYYSDLFDLLFKDGKLTSTMMTLQNSVVAATGKAAASGKARSISNDEQQQEGDGEYSFGESKAPFQRSVSISAIDNRSGAYIMFLRKVTKFAKGRRNHGSAESRAHFENIYKIASAAL